MSDLPDFASYKMTIDAEIGRVETEITERKEQIRVLTEQNTAAQERIENLRGVGDKVAEALTALQAVGPILNPLATSEPPRSRPKIKQRLTTLLKAAGAPGMTEAEIVALVKERDQVELNPGSMRSFLYTAQRVGLVQKQDERWRYREEEQPPAGEDAQPAVQAA